MTLLWLFSNDSLPNLFFSQVLMHILSFLGPEFIILLPLCTMPSAVKFLLHVLVATITTNNFHNGDSSPQLTTKICVNIKEGWMRAWKGKKLMYLWTRRLSSSA